MTSNASSGSSRRWELIALLILFAVVTISRFMFWEISFWEWDEILFSNALHRFNVWEHSPHPPGYIGYVALTRGLNYFLHSDLKSLVFINVFFGSLLVFPLYFLYRHFSSHPVALWATALSLFNPLVWYYSETGFSDVTSLFWVITSLAFIYRYEKDGFFYLGMLSLGIALSIRPQNVLFGIFLVPLFLWLKVRQGHIKSAGVGLGLLVGMCLVWFVPLVRSAGGLQSYMELMRLHGKQTATYDPGYLLLRHEMSLYSFIKTKFVLMWGDRLFARLLMGLTVLGVGVCLWRGHRKAFLLLMLGFLPWALVDFLWMHLYYPKYNLPTVALVSFFVVYGLVELLPLYTAWGKLLAPAVILGFVLFSAQWTLPIVRHLHTINSAPVQLFDYIREHLSPETDAIIFDPRVRVLFPNYLSEFVTISRNDLEESTVEPIQNMNWYYVGLPEPGIEQEVQFYLDNDRMRELGAMFADMGLAKTDVLYGSEFFLEDINGLAYRKLLKPEAHCYVKYTGHPKIFSIESAPMPTSRHAIPVSLELDGQPLVSTTIPSNGRLDWSFLLKAPSDEARSFSTFTIKTSPADPASVLRVDAVGLRDQVN